jgi:NADPH2:quinone reductase
MSHGCDATHIYRHPSNGSSSFSDFSDVAKKFSRNKNGVDVVYDSVGAKTSDYALASLKPRGLCVFYGNASGAPSPVSPLDLATAGSLYITRPILNHYLLTREEMEWRASDLFRWVLNGELQFDVEINLPLEQAAQAHQLLTGGGTTGKILLNCAP